MLYLKELNIENLEMEFNFFQEMPEENGFLIKFKGINYEEFKKEIPYLIEESKGLNVLDGRVPQTYYFLYKDNEIIGLYKVRHYLNEALFNGSGHIGFGILPKYRKMGYATKGLSLAINELKKIIKEDEIFMSCNIDNLGSLKVQLKNGAYIHHSDEEKHYTRIKI